MKELKYKKYIGTPFAKSSTELIKHTEGQGTRYVFLDDRVVDESSIYTIVRTVRNVHEDITSHVGEHAHNCDSAFLFIGNKENLEGLICEVTLDDEDYTVKSPASVFIPKGLKHSYRFIAGTGLYINMVLKGNYNNSVEPS